MSSPQPSSAPSSGRFTVFILGLTAFSSLCLLFAAGYVKSRMDNVEAVMAAPGSAFVNSQESFEQIRRELGYSGFIGFAQNYVATHDGGILPDMRAQLKAANDTLAHVPDRTPGESRRDAQAIVSVFKAALDKAEKDPTNFTGADMVPLYASLPVLDARLEDAAAANRLEAQQSLEFWSTLLTIVSWMSLMLVCTMAAGIYFTLRDRNSVPLRALAQSVKNMARGDMRSSIWGMERQDMVGELARAIDLARYNFSQLPDMSLLSEQGPVRLRFEGNTRSLFEAMMRVISRDSEHVRQQATNLTDTITKQQEAITLISSRVEAVLHNVEKRGLDGDQQVRQVLSTITGSANSLRNAQEHAADQLNRILPYLQERAQGMAEITQITGKQVAQVLASLTLSERGLRASASNSEGAVKKLSSVADDLGERMFGAVNLLQASGKVLSETTEKTQGRLNDAISKLEGGLAPLSVAHPEPPAPVMLDVSPRLEEIAASLEAAQKRLDLRLQEFTEASQTTPVAAPDNAPGGEMLGEMRTRFDDTARQLARLYELAQSVPAAPVPESTSAGDLAGEMRTRFDETTKRLERLYEATQSKPVEVIVEAPPPTPEVPAFFEKFMGVMESGFAAVTERMGLMQGKIDNVEGQLDNVEGQYGRLQEVVLARPPIEVKIDQPPPPPAAPSPFMRDLVVDVRTGFETVTRQMIQLREQISSMAATGGSGASGGTEQMQTQWYQMAGQIEATRTAIEQSIAQYADKLSARMDGLSAQQVPQVDPAAFSDAQKQLEQQTQILEELVAALGIIDTHMQQLKTEIEHQGHDAMAASR